MSDRIRQADEHKGLNELIATTGQSDDLHTAPSNALEILPSSYRIVTKSGRLSGGRACALSARAVRGKQTDNPKS
jgi:hypothetical protein